MPNTRVTRADFLEDPQGKMFADVANAPSQAFDALLEFFNDADRQRRMEESELHHDRSPLAGVVRELVRERCQELESDVQHQPVGGFGIDDFLEDTAAASPSLNS